MILLVAFNMTTDSYQWFYWSVYKWTYNLNVRNIKFSGDGPIQLPIIFAVIHVIGCRYLKKQLVNVTIVIYVVGSVKTILYDVPIWPLVYGCPWAIAAIPFHWKLSHPSNGNAGYALAYLQTMFVYISDFVKAYAKGDSKNAICMFY